MATTSSSSFDAARPRRHQVEIYAHALRTRLQFASFKALNGVGKTSLSDLTSSTLTPVQPLAPSLASNNQIVDQPHSSSSPASTPALSQGESLPSSSQSSTRSTRSIYMDIFGTDFRASSTTPSSSKGLSRATSFASTSTPTKRASSSSNTTSTSTRSLLDKAASSPQLGSPERKNGRFDWHNNPTPAMVAHETKLATEEPFALPTGSPSKRRREESHNASPNNVLLNTPRRSRMQSSGFLPNGHPASSLAQDLGLTAPRTPRSRNASGRHVFAIQPQPLGGEQDQVERDRVASTLAALAEARNAASSSSDSSSGSDRPHTPPPPPSGKQGLGIGFASPSIRRNSTFAQPNGHKRHRRNVSWNVLPVDLQDEQESISRTQDDTAAEGEQDRAAADYLLFLASSPSPSSIKRFSGDAETEASGMLSTPAQVSLWEPFQSSNGSGDGRRSRMQSHAGGPRHTNLSFAGPLTPPPSARKLSKPHEEMVGLGFDVQTLSSSVPSTPSRPSANAQEYIQQRRSSTTVTTPTSPRTPPPELSHKRRRSITREFGGETPGAPGGEQTFSYADFVNVSPSPQPQSTASFAGLDSGRGLSTPTKVDRWTFDRQ
ncbi:hypothetical protein PHBOTO_003954 [Pseudozyma hubeiensis]|nr:hypothetical protein PHBOTO_003954 [Pseudozyma hubeiensis]